MEVAPTDEHTIDLNSNVMNNNPQFIALQKQFEEKKIEWERKLNELQSQNKKLIQENQALKEKAESVNIIKDNDIDTILDEIEAKESNTDIFEEDVYEAISLETCVNNRQVIGGPSKKAMEEVITINANYLDKII